MAASATAKRKYGSDAVYGSLAYDFNNPELYRNEDGITAPRVRPQSQTKVQTRARTVARTKQSLAPASIAGILIAAFLFAITIMAQSKLVSISSEAVSLQQELNQLEERKAKLKISYESAFNMADIEEYAIKSLGMQKPKADQIYYIDTSATDRAVVFAQDVNTGFVDKVSDFILGIVDCFR